MIRRLLLVACFVLGMLVVIHWIAEQQNSMPADQRNLNNAIYLFLLLITWVGPLLAYRERSK